MSKRDREIDIREAGILRYAKPKQAAILRELARRDMGQHHAEPDDFIPVTAPERLRK